MGIISTSLIITALGMGIVFVMIIALWGLMALLVHLTEKHKPETENKSIGESVAASNRKRQAAAAAVASAMSHNNISEPHEFPLPPTALVSAWQAVMRSEILNRRGRRK